MLVNSYYRTPQLALPPNNDFNLVNYGGSNGSANFDLKNQFPTIVSPAAPDYSFVVTDESGVVITNEYGQEITADQ